MIDYHNIPTNIEINDLQIYTIEGKANSGKTITMAKMLDNIVSYSNKKALAILFEETVNTFTEKFGNFENTRIIEMNYNSGIDEIIDKVIDEYKNNRFDVLCLDGINGYYFDESSLYLKNLSFLPQNFTIIMTKQSLK